MAPKNSKELSSTIARLKPGDVLKFKEGNYSVKAQFKVSGSGEKPITIEGSEKVLFHGKNIGKYDPVFQTKGQSYIHFKNLNFEGVRAGVQADEGSHHILIEGLRADHCQFAVKLADASYVIVRDARADNSRNAFRGEGDTHHVVFENVEAYRSKDIYENYDKKYLNGDGFIFENKTHDLVFKNIRTGEHWDAGLDIKGSQVRMENIISYGNKNNLKLWGEDVEISNALLYGAKAQAREDGTQVDGWGVNVRFGFVHIKNATIADNEAGNIKAKEGSIAKISNSVLAQRLPSGKLAERISNWVYENTLWYHLDQPKPQGLDTSKANLWADPKFTDWENKNYEFQADSPALNFQTNQASPSRIGFRRYKS